MGFWDFGGFFLGLGLVLFGFAWSLNGLYNVS